MKKKSNERKILNLIYDESKYAEVIESERPDFKISHKFSCLLFGIEVTEFYNSESNARLKNIPDYFNEIIYQGHYRHKVDKTILKTDEVKIISADGEVKEITRGICQKLPKHEEYANLVANKIQLKGQKFSGYDKNLDHINLIIFDTEHQFNLIPIDQFYRYFYNTQVKEVLFASMFREIFFITVLNKNRKVYIPLKMLLLLAEYYLFGKILMEYPWETLGDKFYIENNNPISESLMRLFNKYLRAKTDKVYWRDKEGAVEVILGGCGIVIKEDHKLFIRSYSDYKLPDDIHIVEGDGITTFFSSEEFRDKEKKILANTSFFTELVFDIIDYPKNKKIIAF